LLATIGGLARALADKLPLDSKQRMPSLEYVTKVLTYITTGDLLLLFRQPHFPDLGVQVPGGSVEAGESLEQAALREATEETGLAPLQLESYLGVAKYELKVDVGPPHLRHFFHLLYTGPLRSRWHHIERRPRARGAPNHFELWWEPLTSPTLLHLDWEMDARLAALKNNLSLP
jgi:8-oxo-dGTP pyrophosphatase MutT (NUDIX family)